MTTALLYEQRVGRFGRRLAGDAPRMADGSSHESPGAEPRFEATSYVVDAEAVAAAIIDRLLAGRTLPPPPRKPRS